MDIEGFKLESADKVERATTNVGAEDEGALLAEYDRLGGYITRDGVKVKNGSFYDLKLKKARKTPEIVCIYQVGDKQVEVPDGAALPGEVRASLILAGQEESASEGAEASSKPKKKKAAKGKKGDVEGDE